METVDQVRGMGLATIRSRRWSVKCPATGRRLLVVRLQTHFVLFPKILKVSGILHAFFILSRDRRTQATMYVCLFYVQLTASTSLGIGVSVTLVQVWRFALALSWRLSTMVSVSLPFQPPKPAQPRTKASPKVKRTITINNINNINSLSLLLLLLLLLHSSKY